MFSFSSFAGRRYNFAALVASQAEQLVAVAVQLLELRPESILEKTLFWGRLMVLLRGEVEVGIL